MFVKSISSQFNTINSLCFLTLAYIYKLFKKQLKSRAYIKKCEHSTLANVLPPNRSISLPQIERFAYAKSSGFDIASRVVCIRELVKF